MRRVADRRRQLSGLVRGRASQPAAESRERCTCIPGARKGYYPFWNEDRSAVLPLLEHGAYLWID